MKKLALIVFILSPILFFGQQSSDSLSNINSVRSTINMQKGIAELMIKNQQINKLNGGIKGYCVQIYLGESREKAQKTKYKFMKLFPEIKNVSYERVSPNWKVRVGKFRTKLESEKLQSLILSEYPNSFIIEIKVPVGEFD